MKSRIRTYLTIVLVQLATTAFAQKTSVVYNTVDTYGKRYIQTSTVVAVKPAKTKYPISISLDYSEAVPGNYFLMLYGRYPLTESTILTLIFDNGTQIQLNPYFLTSNQDKLGLITPKTIYFQYFPLSESQLADILNQNLREVSVDIDGTVHNKKYRTKEVSQWLNRNYHDINKLLSGDHKQQ